MPTKPDPDSVPCSPLAQVCGLSYFPRMIAKIRLQAAGKLWEELHANLGKGQDASCVEFFHLSSYEALRERVLQGGSDEEIFEWCQTEGRPLHEIDKLIWNAFVAKLGWNDHISPILTRRKAESDLSHREDIVTMPHYIDVDEGREV